MDECTTDTDNCTQNCENTDGSFTCYCNDGYTTTDNGITCDGMIVYLYFEIWLCKWYYILHNAILHMKIYNSKVLVLLQFDSVDWFKTGYLWI